MDHGHKRLRTTVPVNIYQFLLLVTISLADDNRKINKCLSSQGKNLANVIDYQGQSRFFAAPTRYSHFREWKHSLWAVLDKLKQ